MKLIHKISIWLLSFSLVVTVVFFDIRFQLPINNDTSKINSSVISNNDEFYGGFIRIDVKESQFEDVEASVLLTVVGYIAMSVFLSLGANYASKFIVLNARSFTQWYQDWYNSVPTLETTTQADIDHWNEAHKIPEYLEKTGQTNTDGTLKDPSKVVLPTSQLKGIYSKADFYINDYVDAGGIQWKEYSFGTSKKMIPTIQGQTIIAFPTEQQYAVINIPSAKTYRPLRDEFAYTISLVETGTGAKRYKIAFLDYWGNPVIRYSSDVTQERINILDQNNGSILLTERNTTTGLELFYLLPLYWQMDFTESIAQGLLFDEPTLTSNTNDGGFSAYGNYFYNNNQYSGVTTPEVVFVDGMPNGTSVGSTDDYVYIPTVTNPDSPTVPVAPVTPVPPEEQAPYVYVPSVPSSYTPLPTDGTWTQIDNPISTIPLPGIEDLLDGTLMKDLWSWFTNWLTYALNGIMGFWESFVNWLFTGINTIAESVKGTFEKFSLAWDLVNGKTITFNGESFDMLDFSCELLPGQKLNWFDSVVFGTLCNTVQVADSVGGFFSYIITNITYISTSLVTSIGSFVTSILGLLNILPTGIRELFIFITSSLTLLLTVKFVRFILDLIGALPIL